jgi:phosphoglycolate phosphatase-like HAD superfamily hydrolase
LAVIAVTFDFDDTLVPDSTSALLSQHGIDPDDFWPNKAKTPVDRGYDPPLAYLNLLLDEVGAGRRLGLLSNETLRTFGASLDSTWFPGLPELFEDLRAAAATYRDISVEFYIISGGLQALIEGSTHVQKYFSGVYGCQLDEDPATGAVRYIKRCVTFTEKTRFIFEINKGISAKDAATQPHLVNLQVPTRRIPLENMIYVGDGLTDVPCFSLIDNAGGMALGVFQPGKESAKQAFQQLVVPRRVRTMHSPNYSADADLGAILRLAVSALAAKLDLNSARAL